MLEPGNMPDYAPAFGNGLTSSLDPAAMADPGWAAAYALLVEYVHVMYGDERVWEEHYAHVARYIDFVVANATDAETGLFTFSRFGDWCASESGPSNLGQVRFDPGKCPPREKKKTGVRA